eukprot:9909399-Ditylum_brightwellii.AAC.1
MSNVGNNTPSSSNQNHNKETHKENTTETTTTQQRNQDQIKENTNSTTTNQDNHEEHVEKNPPESPEIITQALQDVREQHEIYQSRSPTNEKRIDKNTRESTKNTTTNKKSKAKKKFIERDQVLPKIYRSVTSKISLSMTSM